MKEKLANMKNTLRNPEPIKLRFDAKNVDLNVLVENIEKWFKNKKFVTQVLQAESKWLIQATKQSIWRTITASARAYSVRVDGSPNEFTIEIGVGKWINNTASLAIITVLSGTILLPFCGTATIWSKKISRDLKNYINLTIDFVEPASA